MKRYTMTLGKETVVISEEELDRLAPLIEWIQSLAGRMFTPDVSPAMAAPPPHVMTPARIRAHVKASLLGLERADRFEREILETLMMSGIPFVELEAGRATIPIAPPAPAARRSRLLQS